MGPDITKIPAQFNLKIPWVMKEFIRDKANELRTSQNQLGVDCILAIYGEEYERYVHDMLVEQTRQAGATS